MSGPLKEAELNARQARAALARGLHWRQLDADVHLGYRKGAKGGHWLVRWYVGAGNYKRATIGVADDLIAQGTLSFDEAGRNARALVAEVRTQAARHAAACPETVKSAVTTYIAMRREAQSAKPRHVLQIRRVEPAHPLCVGGQARQDDPVSAD